MVFYLRLEKVYCKMFFGIFISVIIAIIFWRIKYSRHYYLLSKIPSPRKYPVLYHSPHFFNINPIKYFNYLETLNGALGDVYHVCFGDVTNAFCVIADAKIIEELLTSNVEIDKTMEYKFLTPWIGHGLLVSSGKKWSQKRKVEKI